jgi:hypothetical protein
VDLDVISFTVSFGSSNPSNAPIPWEEFKTSFLPPRNISPPPAGPTRAIFFADGAAAAVPTDTYCSSRITAGLLKDLKNNGSDPNALDWVVDPNHFQITTHSVFPSKQAFLISGNGSATNPSSQSTPETGSWNTSFGVGPAGVSDNSFESTHTVSLFKVTGGTEDLAYDFTEHSAVTPVIQNIPRSAWSADMALSPSISKVNSKSSTIANVLVGFQISPQLTVPDHTLKINVGVLQATWAPAEPVFQWTDPVIAFTDPFDQSQAIGTLTNSIGSPPVAATRTSIIQALIRQNLILNPEVRVSGFETSANFVLLDAPLLSYLGEERGA